MKVGLKALLSLKRSKVDLIRVNSLCVNPVKPNKLLIKTFKLLLLSWPMKQIENEIDTESYFYAGKYQNIHKWCKA